MCALALLAGSCTSAFGQYIRGGGGRLLERDLGKYNSGGLSGRNLNESFKFARNVSFGKAGGGFSFMGNLGTTDYSDFVGRTGSDDLRDFSNRSQSSGLAGRGVKASDTASYVQSLTAGTKRPTAFKGSFEVPNSSYSKGYDFNTSADFNGLPEIGQRSGSRRGNPNGLLTDPLGDADRMSRRSLGGAGGRGAPTSVDPLGSTQLSAKSRSQVDLGKDPLSESSRSRAGKTDTLSGLTGRGLENKGVGIPGVQDNGLSGGPSKSLEDSARRNDSARLALREASKARVSASPSRIDTSIDTRIPDTSAAGDRPPGALPASSYDTLIKKLDTLGAPPDLTKKRDGDSNAFVQTPTNPADRTRNQRQTGPGKAGSRPTPGPTSLTGDDGVANGINDLRSRLLRGSGANEGNDISGARVRPIEGLVGGSDWLARRSNTLSTTGAVLSSSERALRDAARTRAERNVKVTGQSDPAVDPNAPRPLPDLDATTLRAIREAGGVIDTFVPVNPAKRDPYTEHVKAAQEALTSGQFFDADDRFSQAASIRPSELAPQIGRIHSEIGGAVFRTAAANLRRFLRARPEAAAVRYDAKLLPSQERIDDLVPRLRELSAQGGQTGRDAALLMSYLGFQTSNTLVRDEGLATLQKLGEAPGADSDPRDGVLARFLGGVWTAPAAEPSPATPGAAEKPSK